MIQEAYQLLALDEIRLSAIVLNQTIISYLGPDSANICNLVNANGVYHCFPLSRLADLLLPYDHTGCLYLFTGNNMSSALYAGLAYCSDIQTIGNFVYGKLHSACRNRCVH